MIASTRFFRERSVALLAGTLCALAALGGCSSGGGGRSGGGAGGGSSGNAFTYPESLATATSADSVDGFSSAYSVTGNVLTPRGNEATSTGSTIRLTVNGPNNYTFTVLGLQPEPPFSFTVTPTDDVSNPFSVAGANCASCFRSRSVGAVGVNGEVDFIDIDLDRAGLRYSTLGLWSKPSSSTANTQIGGAVAFGVLTRNVDLPASGTATYNGLMIGRYADGAGVYTIGAAATGLANFGGSSATVNGQTVGGRSVAFSTSDTTKTLITGTGTSGIDLNLNLSGTLTYSAGINSLSSAPNGITSAGYGMTGVAKGAFFGPPSTTSPFVPPEFAGAVSVSNATGQSMVGSFALKTQ